MLRIQPLPDELAQGYMGRLARIHGWHNDTASRAAMISWLRTQGQDGLDYSVIELLASVACQSLGQFTQSHTILPFRRFVTHDKDDVEGPNVQRSTLKLFGTVELRPHPCFCEQCVIEDVKFHGFSYWRRSHQLPGLFWCTKHGQPLRYVTKDRPFAQAPEGQLHTAETFEVDWVEGLRRNKCIERYVEIAHELLENTRLVNYQSYEREIQKRCEEIGLGSEQGMNSVALTSYVAGMCDQRWQSTLRYRKSHQFKKPRQGRTGGKISCDTSTVVLNMAAMFDSATQALDRLKTSQPLNVIRPRVDPETLRNLYKVTYGNHVTMGNILGVESKQVNYWMEKLGLPPIGNNDHAKMGKVLERLIRGDVSLAQACADEDLQLPYMRKRLEVALTPLMGFLKEFAATPVEKVGRWQTGQRSQERIARLRAKLPGAT